MGAEGSARTYVAPLVPRVAVIVTWVGWVIDPRLTPKVALA